MTKTFAMVVSLALIVTLAVSPVWAVGDKVRSDNAAGPAGDDGGGDPQASRGTPVDESVQNLSVQEGVTGKKGQSGTSAILTEDEEEALLFMREEEKLARDVYLTLGEKWPELAIFTNIAASEQKHMDAVLQLLVKYSLTDPADGPGVFVDADLKKLYGQLVEKGLNSIVDALEVGIIIEEEDIADLKYYLGLTDKKDIKQVFENLLEGSKNHLDAFDRNLENY
jgi:hypothetical protein